MKITDLIIDEEFEKVIPPLSDDEFELLKESILNDGEVYHPLIVWNNIIVDGHHRYKILKEHPEIKYRISEKSFDDRLEVISWICMNQLGRRNLTGAQKSVLIGRRYKAEKQKREFHGNQYTKDVVSPKSWDSPKTKTSHAIAEEMGVSHGTVENAEKFVDGVDAAEEVLPGIAKDITSGKIKPKQADVVAIAKAPVAERKQLAENLYKTLTPEEKEQRKNKRNFVKSLRALDATHFPSADNKIQPEDMLMTFCSEMEKIIGSMDFCLGYSPELLTDPNYFSQIQKAIQPVKDYFKNLEENRSIRVSKTK